MVPMESKTTEKIRTLLSAGQVAAASETLQRLAPADAARVLIGLPFEGQQSLFRALAPDFAARVISYLPYYHAYVLLQSLSNKQMRVVIDLMAPDERDGFLDELPEETWQSLIEELSAAGAESGGTAKTGVAELEVPPTAAVPAAAAPIVEARGIEKTFQQPDGRQIEVIAPMDLSIEPDTVMSRCWGLRDRASPPCCACFRGWPRLRTAKCLWHGKSHRRMPAERGHRVSELRAVSLADGAGQRGGAAVGARHGALGTASTRAAGSRFRGPKADSRARSRRNFPEA